jgi:hypothetical protein
VIRVPSTATHLVLSVGGNKALLRTYLLETSVTSSREALLLVAKAVDEFSTAYAKALAACLNKKLTLVVCIIYDGNFTDQNYHLAARTALSALNDVIV